MANLIYGVGINDANYLVNFRTRNGRVRCQLYSRWHDLIRRCYSINFHNKHPSYADCTVCDEWFTFSNFKSWMELQDWKGKELDKDILVIGNKHYSPELCVFVSKQVNLFTTDRCSLRGSNPIGVDFNSIAGKFRAQCSNPFTGKQEFLGNYDNQAEAHYAWKDRKHEIACQLADIQTDDRVANALRLRYA